MMSSPAKKVQSPVPEAKSPTVQSPKGKTKSPTPGPASPTPGPASPTPGPASPTPGPASPTPGPASPTPGPASPTPGPASPTPGPASPVAAHDGAPTDLLSGAHWGELEIPDDEDSTLGSDAESSRASISSSILQYRTISGRRYHSDSVTDGEYWGPNDEKAMEVMDIFHHAMTLILNDRLYTAPLSKDIKNAIDIGTGTVFALMTNSSAYSDFADEFPTCNVVGTDISAIQPDWVPPNLQFDIDDASKTWTYPDNHFDYVHIRWLCCTMKDWASLYKEAYRCTKPGGWIEHFDGGVHMVCLDGTMPKDSAIGQWGHIWTEVERKTGVIANMLDGCMENGIKEAGFTNVQTEDFLAPTAPWPTDERQKQIGLFQYISLTSDVEGFLTYFLGQVMGWTENEMAKYASVLRREYKEGKIHANIKWRVVRAQKPVDA
ncbi:S-adenosyl-L-methionine-dependent methyltransferase [Pseudoneurospora amorphoporcata]|uniref:S-adenosyl-L-methionine-dependent methyltransferase n=1 Tax=Pseudoneurospora amorphoporcata TaxID=241081 RepID=A0AAN6NTS2_9PEZI|nr:S-adenosyl-L-methionine-dependent methyltransferase [Pseudoneurospora amorphoporcata]